jgi:hypothetical protein
MAHDTSMDMQLNDLESSPSTVEKASLGNSIHASTDADVELVSDPNSVVRYRLYKRRFAGTVGFVRSFSEPN